MAAYKLTYFDMGGLQVQLSFADVETLREAQQHPERHRDLMVRITGYSAAFVDMTRAAQDAYAQQSQARTAAAQSEAILSKSSCGTPRPASTSSSRRSPTSPSGSRSR